MTRRMRRRSFLVAAGAWPALRVQGFAHAQPAPSAGKIPRVGILTTSERTRAYATSKLFVDTMRGLGWIEGHNVSYDYAYADGHEARLPAAAAQLLGSAPDVVKVSTSPEAKAVLGLAPAIPLVFSGANDPVANGLVKSLARPGANVTGIANIGRELGPRRLQLALEAMPKLTRLGVLDSPRIAPKRIEPNLIENAAPPQLTIVVGVANDPAALEDAFAIFANARVQAVMTTHLALYQRERKRILQLAAGHRLPVIAHRSEMAESGALLSYSSVLSEQIRRSAHLVDKILKGTKPAEIPVEQPTKFELVVNLKTARALGIGVPQSLLLQATRVIE